MYDATMTTVTLLYVVTVGMLLVLLAVEHRLPAHRHPHRQRSGHHRVSAAIRSDGVVGTVGVIALAVALLVPIVLKVVS